MLAASVFAWSASVVLGVVFIAAGALKLRSGHRWLTQAADLGVPQLIACRVPWVELVVGALTVLRVAPPLGALAALALLAAFTVLLVVRLRDGDRPPCACFGVMAERPLSWWSVGRNVALAALAVVAMVG